MNLLLIFISIFHKTLKKPCLCDSDVYFLFGTFRFRTAIASKPFFLPLFLLVRYFPFLFFICFPYFLSLLYSEQLSAGIRNRDRLSEFIFQKECILSRRRERDGLFCMIPPTVYFLSSVIVAV